jgi:hypothetical protein
VSVWALGRPRSDEQVSRPSEGSDNCTVAIAESFQLMHAIGVPMSTAEESKISEGINLLKGSLHPTIFCSVDVHGLLKFTKQA